jgi:RNA-directed DNA polymerase
MLNAPTRKSILELTHEDAKSFLLKTESYCNIDLPPYIKFDDLIEKVNKCLESKRFNDCANKPSDHDDVNYSILNNKDGRYAWRPLQLIHPAVYVAIVHAITEEKNWELIRGRFAEFAANSKLTCLSLPVVSISEEKDKAEQISHWWTEVEQRSIELSLDFRHLLETDITDCYGAIYTHSIAWALHTKTEAKKQANRRNMSLIGVFIDAKIQDMRHGQTNGIPQGSVLMDFIAEMVLGLADKELSSRIYEQGIKDYRILRYRDDYRIFTNNQQNGEHIVKLITETLTDLGLKLNPAKTKSSSDIVKSSIKADKQAWFTRKQVGRNLQKQLLIIHDHSLQHSNSGSLQVALNDFHKKILGIKRLTEAPKPLIAIIVDIAYRNPRTYPICSAILSKLLTFLNSPTEKLDLANKICNKFSQIPNTGLMEIWLQRVTLPLDKNFPYEEPLCKLIAGEKIQLWNNDWISSAELKSAVDASLAVNTKIRDNLPVVLSSEEADLFMSNSDQSY